MYTFYNVVFFWQEAFSSHFVVYYHSKFKAASELGSYLIATQLHLIKRVWQTFCLCKEFCCLILQEFSYQRHANTSSKKLKGFCSRLLSNIAIKKPSCWISFIEAAIEQASSSVLKIQIRTHCLRSNVKSFFSWYGFHSHSFTEVVFKLKMRQSHDFSTITIRNK